LLTRAHSFVPTFKEVDIQEQSSTHKQTLLSSSRTIGEVHQEGIRIGEQLRSKTLRLLENLPNKGSITVRIFLIGRINAEWNLATSLTTAGISFGKAIHAHTATAARGMDFVNWILVRIHNDERRQTIPVGFLDHTNILSTTGHGCLLIAAALACSRSTLEGAINSDNFSTGALFLHVCLERVNRGAETPAAEIGIIKGCSDLSAIYEVLECQLL